MKKHTAKRDGLALEFKTFKGRSGKSYLVFRTLKGGYHVFAETEAKEAALDCDPASKGNTREQWKALWDSYAMRKLPEPKIEKAEPRGQSALERLRSRSKG